jgi:IS5 family transposase
VKVSFCDRTAEARALQHSIGAWLRRRSDEAKDEVLAITGQLADLAAAAVDEAATALLYKARRRNVQRMLDDLAVLVERTVRVIDQARARVNGDQPPGATRLVSLHEPDARPIRKGRLGKPVEFGYKAQVVDNPDGLILDHSVHIGNPADNELLRPALERITIHLGLVPALVTADRGYWDSTVEPDLVAGGVTSVVIPRTGKPSAARAAIEHTDLFIAAVKWRTGSEGRISHLKRDWQWRRTRLRSHPGARIWCGHGVFAHNLVKLIAMKR